MARLQEVVVSAFPTPVWVRGEVTGFRRTSGGAVFFRLADPTVDGQALEVGGRGRVMAEVERALSDAGLGRLGDGVEVKVRGTVGIESRNSVVRLSLLEVDPTFTAGRLAIERAEVIKRMTADGSIRANGELPLPLVPLRVGLVTSRGSAAHGDFIDQLRRSGFRFRVRTAHVTVQGAAAPGQISNALARFGDDQVDVVALVRGGGSQLDLAPLDSEEVARAVAASPVPVVTGIGHDIDRSVADEAAAIAEKTPSAAGEWLVARVMDFESRLTRARHLIGREARSSLRQHQQLLRVAAGAISGGVSVLRRQTDILERLGEDIAETSRQRITDQRALLESLADWFSAVDIESTLRRGFAIVIASDGKTVIKSQSQVARGDQLTVRIAGGTFQVEVSDS